MNDEQLLASVKANLGFSTAAYDTALQEKIDAAKAYIEREGASLEPSSSAEDAQLVVMYAVWLWDKRLDSTAAMPRMLRWALNNRIFGAAMEGDA